MSVEELAKLRGEDPAKFTEGLECSEMAICPPDFTVIDLATEAAKRALGRWDGDLDRIGMIAIGKKLGVGTSVVQRVVARDLGTN